MGSAKLLAVSFRSHFSSWTICGNVLELEDTIFPLTLRERANHEHYLHFCFQNASIMLRTPIPKHWLILC